MNNRMRMPLIMKRLEKKFGTKSGILRLKRSSYKVSFQPGTKLSGVKEELESTALICSQMSMANFGCSR